jgi:hypothetical protein
MNAEMIALVAPPPPPPARWGAGDAEDILRKARRRAEIALYWPHCVAVSAGHTAHTDSDDEDGDADMSDGEQTQSSSIWGSWW